MRTIGITAVVLCLFVSLAVQPVSANGLGLYGSYLDGDDFEAGYGAGAKLKLDIIDILALDFRGSWIRFDEVETDVIPIEAALLLQIPGDSLVLYGGVGVGIFRQSLGADTDVGSLRALILGAKMKLGPLVVVRGEYRRLTLSGAPLLPMTARITAGAGISF